MMLSLQFAWPYPLHGDEQSESGVFAPCGGNKSPHKQFDPPVKAITGLFMPTHNF